MVEVVVIGAGPEGDDVLEGPREVCAKIVSSESELTLEVERNVP